MIGTLYHWKDYGAKISRIDVLHQPGARYSALFALADPEFPDTEADPREDYAGKLMALAGFSRDQVVSSDVYAVVEGLLNFDTLYPFNKEAFRET